MVKAKGDIIDTENAMNGVAEAGESAGNGVSEMNAQLKRVGDGVNFQQVTSGLGKITDGLEKAAKKAISLGKQIASTMIEAGSWADDLQTRAANYQITPEELQRMQYTAEQIDTSVGSIVNAQKYLRKGLGKQDELVMGGLVELLGEGYDPRGKDWEDVFWDAGEALMRFTNAEEKEVYAQKLFGRSWEELIPLFTAGRKEYEEMNASWTVVSQESIDKLQSMDDEYHKMMANWETFKYEALAQFAEPMSQAFQAAQSALGKFMDYLKSDEGQALIDNAVNSLKKAIEWISEPENIQKAIDSLKVILAGWAMLTVGKDAVTIMSFLNGIRNFRLGKENGSEGTGDSNGSTGTGTTGTGATGGTDSPVMFDTKVSMAAATAVVLDTTTKLLENAKLLDDETKSTEENVRAWAKAQAESGFISPDKIDELTEKNLKMLEAAEAYKNGTLPAANPVNLSDWTYGDEYSADELMAMVKAAEDLTGASETTRKSSSEMTEAAGTMKGLPGTIESAILRGMSQVKIYIDGQLAGNAMTPTINSIMGGIVAAAVGAVGK